MCFLWFSVDEDDDDCGENCCHDNDDKEDMKNDLPLRGIARCVSCGYHRSDVQAQRPRTSLIIHYHISFSIIYHLSFVVLQHLS